MPDGPLAAARRDLREQIEIEIEFEQRATSKQTNCPAVARVVQEGASKDWKLAVWRHIW